MMERWPTQDVPLSYDSWNKLQPLTMTLTSITVKKNNALKYECHDVIL